MKKFVNRSSTLSRRHFSVMDRFNKFLTDSKDVLFPNIREILQDEPAVDVLKVTDSWEIFNDSDYQGLSHLSFSRDDSTGALHLKGDVKLPVNTRKARGGFVAIKTKYKANLMDYYGLEMKVKNNLSVPIRITLNMKCESYIENDMYQVDVEILGGKVSVVSIPFASFCLTSFGYERAVQRSNDYLRVETLGVLISTQLQIRDFSIQSEYIIEHEDEASQPQKKDFPFDIVILSLVAVPHGQLESRELEHRKNTLRKNNKK